MARHFRGSGHILRFIEFMDVGSDQRLADGRRRARGRDRRARSAPSSRSSRSSPTIAGEVAERWRYRDGGGEIGVIASVTQPFCRDCTRARLSTDGKLYTCLFAADGHDLRALLRGGASDEELAAAIAERLARPRRPLLGAPHGRDRRPAEGRDVVHRRLSRIADRRLRRPPAAQ